MSANISVIVRDRDCSEVTVSVIGDEGSCYSHLVDANDLQQWIDELRVAQRRLSFIHPDPKAREVR